MNNERRVILDIGQTFITEDGTEYVAHEDTCVFDGNVVYMSRKVLNEIEGYDPHKEQRFLKG